MNANRPIYRSDAVARYVAARQEAILPRMVRPKTQIYLWIGLGFVLVLTLMAWWTEIPTYQAGVGTFITAQDTAVPVELIALFPATQAASLRPDATLLVTLPSGERLTMPIRHLSAPLSPLAVRERYPQIPTTTLLQEPTLVVTGTIEGDSSVTEHSLWEGSTLRVETQTGSYRLLSLLPLIGAWFG